MTEHEPRVPQPVLDAIDHLADGDTATEEDIREALKF